MDAVATDLMQIVSINVSKPIDVEYQGKMISTGIFKMPVKTRLKATATGLETDGQADLKVHGGVDKALYAYSVENYPYWAQEFGKAELPYGQFGENLTVDGMTDEVVHIGDTYRIGKLIAQVSQPRVPCYKLGLKVGSSQFPKQFMKSGRVGFYLRVLVEAEIGVGDSIEKLDADPIELSVYQSMLALYKGPQQMQIIDQALQIKALSDAWRIDLAKRRENLFES